METDLDLLEAYARAGSEAAFGELVRRHVDLVYSSAFRRLGQREDLARDATQAVFTDLALKAGRVAEQRRRVATGDPAEACSLAGWLCTAARFEAGKRVRQEQRRQQRELEAMSELSGNTPVPPHPEELQAEVEHAMEELSEADRDALVLRFLEGRDLRAVGQALGLSEDAARMRVNRAVERLRLRLSARGVTAATAVLMVVLAQLSSQAAPAGLGALVAREAVSAQAAAAAAATVPQVSSTTVGTLFMASQTSKWIAAGILGALAVTATVAVDRYHHHLAAVAQQRNRTQMGTEVVRRVLLHASDNGDTVPVDLSGLGPEAAGFELVYAGRLQGAAAPNRTPLIRDRRPWKTAVGLWARTYGFLDGHVEVVLQETEDFTAWEADIKAGRPTRLVR